MTLEPIEQLALAKLDITKPVRRQIDPGNYDVDLVVRIVGTIGVGKDYPQTLSAAVPWRDMFLALLSQMAPALRRAFVADYLAASAEGQPAAVNASAIADEVNELCAEIMGTSERVCSGKTRAVLSVEALQDVTLIERAGAA